MGGREIEGERREERARRRQERVMGDCTLFVPSKGLLLSRVEMTLENDLMTAK